MLSIVFSGYGLGTLIAVMVLVGSAYYTLRGLRMYAIERRINRIASQSAQEEVKPQIDIDIVVPEDKIENTISRVLPSLQSTRLNLRRSGTKISIRIYVLAILFAGMSSSLVVSIPFVPPAGMPLVASMVLHYFVNLFVLPFFIKRRQRKILRQMPEMVDYVVRSLAVGQALDLALREVSADLEAPLGPEMDVISKMIDVGLPLSEALSLAAAQIQSPEFEFFVFACVAQIKSGGNLVMVLRSLSDTIRSRLALVLEINAMTAEGKMSAIFLGCLPLALLAYLWASNYKFVAPLFVPGYGHGVLYGILALVTVGTYVAWRIVQIKE